MADDALERSNLMVAEREMEHEEKQLAEIDAKLAKLQRQRDAALRHIGSLKERIAQIKARLA